MKLDGARIAVIGGAGFVGSHIVDRLLLEAVEKVVVFDNFVRGTRRNLEAAVADPRVTVVDGSITDMAQLQSIVEGCDGVFHLAALWLYECVHQPRAAVEVNVAGTWNVIEACQAAGVKKVVYSSSASVYGDALAIPMTEEHPFNNRTLYGATKIAGEQFFRASYEQRKMDYVGLRYMNVYGPRMDYKGTYVSVIMKVLDRIEAGEAPIIWGDGSQAYDFVHVEDVARRQRLVDAERGDRCVPQRRLRRADQHQRAGREAAAAHAIDAAARVPAQRADVRHQSRWQHRKGESAPRLRGTRSAG